MYLWQLAFSDLLGNLISFKWVFEYVLFPIGIPLGIFFMAEYRFRQIGQTLPTRYIGSFPRHLNEIIAVVKGAKREILILVDCIDYGSFRALDLEVELLDAISEAKAGGEVEVKFLVWSQWQTMSRANKYRDEHARLSHGFPALVQAYLADLKRLEPKLVNEIPEAFASARAAALDRHTDWKHPIALFRILNALHEWQRFTRLAKVAPLVFFKKGQRKEDMISKTIQVSTRLTQSLGREPTTSEIAAEMGQMSGDLPPPPEVFFWIADQREAVFLLPCHGQDALAFLTHDRRLITTLALLF
jgi:hypothetical protein